MKDIIRGISKSIGGTIVTLGLSALMIKLLAVVSGPTGVGVFSILRQAQQTGTNLSTFGGQTAITQGIASIDEKHKKHFSVTCAHFFILGNFLLFIILQLFPETLGHMIFSDKVANYSSLAKTLSLPILLGSMNAYLLGVMAGYREVGKIAIAQIAGSSLALVYTIFVAEKIKYGQFVFANLLLSVLFTGSIVVCLIYNYKYGWLKVNFLKKPNFSDHYAKHFQKISYSFLLVSVLSVGIILIVKSAILRLFGVDEVGIFDAAWTLSMMYVMLILNSFSAYYLPSLAGIQDNNERIAYIKNTFNFVITLLLPLIGSVIALKPLYIHFFYSAKFLPSLETIRWMLLGDYFRVLSWVFSVTMIAYSDMKSFVILELSGNLLLMLLIVGLLWYFRNIEYTGIAFFIINSLYFCVVLRYAFLKFKLSLDKRSFVTLVGYFCVLLVASLFFWKEQRVNFMQSVLFIAFATATAISAMSVNQRTYLFQMLKLRKFVVSCHDK